MYELIRLARLGLWAQEEGIYALKMMNRIAHTEGEAMNRCELCGRFISYEAIQNGEVVSRFQPDTHFTSEDSWYEHKQCQKKPE